MTCTNCGRDFEDDEGPVASISGGICGDECTESYFACPKCGAYTVSVCWDVFLGEESVSVRGPLTPAEAQEQLDLIARCPEPWDKKCRCDAHRAYFHDMLD